MLVAIAVSVSRANKTRIAILVFVFAASGFCICCFGDSFEQLDDKLTQSSVLKTRPAVVYHPLSFLIADIHFWLSGNCFSFLYRLSHADSHTNQLRRYYSSPGQSSAVFSCVAVH